MFQVAQSIANHGSLLVQHDVFGLNRPYSSYGIGMSLAMIPLYELAHVLGGDPVAAAMDVNAVIFALTMVTLVVLAQLVGLTLRQALAVAGLIGGGTLLIAYTATDFSEPAIALAIALGLLAVEGARIGRSWAPPLAGAAAGLAVLFRADSLILVVPLLAVGVWWPRGRRLRSCAEFVIVLAPALGLLAWYNAVRFGAPWRMGYPGQLRFSNPLLSGIYGLLFSPGRGLFVYVPLTLVAVAGARWAWRRAPSVTAIAGALLAVRLVFYALWWGWDGAVSWGPRFLLPALPCLALGLMEVVRRFGRLRWSAQTAIGLIAVTSIAMNTVAAFVEVTALKAGVLFDNYALQSLPFVDEPRAFLNGRHFVSRTFDPHLRLTQLVILLAAAVGGAALAIGGPALTRTAYLDRRRSSSV
jgi:hypothetical protein